MNVTFNIRKDAQQMELNDEVRISVLYEQNVLNVVRLLKQVG